MKACLPALLYFIVLATQNAALALPDCNREFESIDQAINHAKPIATERLLNFPNAGAAWIRRLVLLKQLKLAVSDCLASPGCTPAELDLRIEQAIPNWVHSSQVITGASWRFPSAVAMLYAMKFLQDQTPYIPDMLWSAIGVATVYALLAPFKEPFDSWLRKFSFQMHRTDESNQSQKDLDHDRLGLQWYATNAEYSINEQMSANRISQWEITVTPLLLQADYLAKTDPKKSERLIKVVMVQTFNLFRDVSTHHQAVNVLLRTLLANVMESVTDPKEFASNVRQTFINEYTTQAQQDPALASALNQFAATWDDFLFIR